MVSSKSQQLGLSALVAGLLLAAIAAITLFGLLTSRYGWKIYLEVFSHFQLQYCVICVVLLVLLGLTRRRLMSLLGLFCCSALLATQILPWYFPPVWLSPRPQSDLRVLIANVNTQNQQFEQVLALTRQVQPDLALFMEVNDVWVSQLNTLQDILPFSSAEASPYNFGIALYSRLALDSPEIVQFSPDSTASITAAIEVAGRSLSLVAAHPLPPAKSSFFQARNQQLAAMATYLQSLSAPVLVIGDFNITMWSPYYKRFIGLTKLKNARQGFGLLPSWPTSGTYRQIPDWASLLFSVPIDHCLVSPELRVASIRTGANIGSDHRPVIVELAAE